jgi:hypothetical protein
MRVESNGRRTSSDAAPNSAPPTAPIPPTTDSAKICRLVTSSKFCGVIDDSCIE